MVIDEIIYLSYEDALVVHFELMWAYGEVRFGVFIPDLIESALARPQQAAIYEDADISRQAATLCFGLIKNHPWVGGNKRTATAIVAEFLLRNGYTVRQAVGETAKMVFAVEADQYGVDEIETWYRQRIIFIGKPQ